MVSKEEMKASLHAALEASILLKKLDTQIQERIVEIEELLWDRGFDAFESGEYSYACRRGQWRFIRTKDRTPVLNLKRDERSDFLRNLVIPGLMETE